MQKLYNISLEQYNTMLNEQDGVCAICKKVNDSGKALHVDHKHSTGEVRGLLCYRCNAALGYFKDSVTRIERAIEYLEAAN